MDNEKKDKQAIVKEKEEQKKEKKRKHLIPTYLKPISELVAKMKAQKFGSKDIKPIKYKAVISSIFIRTIISFFFFRSKESEITTLLSKKIKEFRK